ncbi:MAG: PorP/SprF family type IX secretion system membrane protein [Bacteroidota bacterium]
MRRLFLLFPLLAIAVSLSAQDKHFTQFYAAPLTLNPALTGAFDGRYRVGAIYRDQWRGVLDEPYVTFASSIDVKFDVNLNNRYKDAVAVGLLFFSDRVNGFDFNTNQIALSGAFHKGLDFNKTQFLTVGFQAGLAQRNINYERLTFDDQFNDIDAFSFATREALPENNFSFSDYAVGLNYSYQPKAKTALNIGFALHHFLRPQLSFYASDEDVDGDSRLFMKYSIQASFQFPVSDQISLIPRAQFSQQGPHMELTTGTNVRFAFNNFNTNAFQVGTWVRPVSNEDDSFSLDALIMMVGIELNSVLIGFSYDANLSDLSTHRQGQGAFEFSIAYIGDFDNESILCPKF